MVAATRELMEVHRRDFRISERLTRYFFEGHRGEGMISPAKVLRTLYNAKIKFVLMGTHGLATWRKHPRATEDVDILVALSNVKKAVKVLHEAFPKLEVVDASVVTRFVHPKTKRPVIDLMKPVQDVFRLALRHVVAIDDYQSIPTLEMALISKFAAMISPNRRGPKKMIDAGDFMQMTLSNAGEIDMKKLKRFAESVYQGAAEQVEKMVLDVLAGKTLRV